MLRTVAQMYCHNSDESLKMKHFVYIEDDSILAIGLPWQSSRNVSRLEQIYHIGYVDREESQPLEPGQL